MLFPKIPSYWLIPRIYMQSIETYGYTPRKNTLIQINGQNVNDSTFQEVDDVYKIKKVQLLYYHISVTLDERRGLQVTVMPTMFNAENKQS